MGSLMETNRCYDSLRCFILVTPRGTIYSLRSFSVETPITPVNSLKSISRCRLSTPPRSSLVLGIFSFYAFVKTTLTSKVRVLSVIFSNKCVLFIWLCLYGIFLVFVAGVSTITSSVLTMTFNGNVVHFFACFIWVHFVCSFVQSSYDKVLTRNSEHLSYLGGPRVDLWWTKQKASVM